MTDEKCSLNPEESCSCNCELPVEEETPVYGITPPFKEEGFAPEAPKLVIDTSVFEGAVMTLDDLTDVEDDFWGKPLDDSFMDDYQACVNGGVPVIQDCINRLKYVAKETISDGYHTFKELYQQRATLWRFICSYHFNQFNSKYTVYKCKNHYDGSSYDGMFLSLIIGPDGEQMSFHLDMSLWESTAGLEFDNSPVEWDGHTPKDVMDRLEKLIVELND